MERVVRGHLVDAKHFDDLGREGGREGGQVCVFSFIA